MGWSGSSLHLRGEGTEASARRFEEVVWDELVYQHWRGRLWRDHHLELLNGEWRWDGLKREVEAAYREEDKPGWTITWWFYDYSPQTLLMHWLHLALAARADTIRAEARRLGFEVTTDLGTVAGVLGGGLRYSVFIDTETDLLKIDRTGLDWDGQATVWSDRRWASEPLANHPPKVRMAVHQAVESGICACPLCRDARLSLGLPRR